MIRTPYHALLSRHDYDLLRRFNPDALWKVHWIEERPEALADDRVVVGDQNPDAGHARTGVPRRPARVTPLSCKA